MYNFMKKGAFMLLVACLAMGMASCSDDDPDYSNVTPDHNTINRFRSS